MDSFGAICLGHDLGRATQIIEPTTAMHPMDGPGWSSSDSILVWTSNNGYTMLYIYIMVI